LPAATLIKRFGGEIHGHTLLIKLKPYDRRTEGVGGAVPAAVLGSDEPQGAREGAGGDGGGQGWTAEGMGG
jgi:hypothetical protein